MLFDKPILFEDAMQSAKVKALLPTTLSSAELAPIRRSVGRNALASARVYEARFLQDLADVVSATLQAKAQGGDGLNLPTARLQLREKLKAYGYTPPAGQEGRITDLTSDQRLNLMVQTQVDLNRGFGQYVQNEEPGILETWPAQELYRAEPRIEPRDWEEIWGEAAAKVDRLSLEAFKATGRFVALKSSPIWMTISDFGLPYPPFKFQSGMKVEDVERQDAIDLGLMTEDDRLEPLAPETIGFKASAEGLSEKVKKQLLDELGDGYVFKDGVLTTE